MKSSLAHDYYNTKQGRQVINEAMKILFVDNSERIKNLWPCPSSLSFSICFGKVSR